MARYNIVDSFGVWKDGPVGVKEAATSLKIATGTRELEDFDTRMIYARRIGGGPIELFPACPEELRQQLKGP